MVFVLILLISLFFLFVFVLFFVEEDISEDEEVKRAEKRSHSEVYCIYLQHEPQNHFNIHCKIGYGYFRIASRS